MIGIVEGSDIKIVNYMSRSDFNNQAFMLDGQFPSLEIIKAYLADFDHDEIMVESVRSLRKLMPTLGCDGIFLYVGEKSQWHIFNTLDLKFNPFIGIYEESPEVDQTHDHICSCQVKKNATLKAALDNQITPDKVIFTNFGYERYCLHCHGYEPEDNFYLRRVNNGRKIFDAVCKSCYIPHFKPYKMKAAA